MEQGRRRLTQGEIALARQAFSGRIAYDRVTAINGAAGNPVAATAIRNGNSAITLRHRIHFHPAYYLTDFSTAKAAAKGLLIHELTHVWQYRRLGLLSFLACYVRDFAACGFRASGMYAYEPGMTPFAEARLEAQAQMAGDYMDAIAAGDATRQHKLRLNLAGSGLYGL